MTTPKPSPQYLAAVQWAPPPGVLVDVIQGHRTGLAIAILRCGQFFAIEYVVDAHPFAVGIRLDDLSMSLLIQQDEPEKEPMTLTVAGMVFEDNVSRMGGGCRGR